MFTRFNANRRDVAYEQCSTYPERAYVYVSSCRTNEKGRWTAVTLGFPLPSKAAGTRVQGPPTITRHRQYPGCPVPDLILLLMGV